MSALQPVAPPRRTPPQRPRSPLVPDPADGGHGEGPAGGNVLGEEGGSEGRVGGLGLGMGERFQRRGAQR